jgi:TonB family protein
MLPGRNFQIALAFSLIVHTAVVINYPALKLPSLQKKPLMVKISYLKSVPQLSASQKQSKPKRTAPVDLPSQVSAFDKAGFSPPAGKDNFLDRVSRAKLPPDQAVIKPAVTRTDVMSVKKKITLPPVDMEKMNSNPSYVSYYQFVREKIRRAVYQNYNRDDTGEVYMSFIIASNGILREVRLIEDKSSVNYYLRETALRSIRDASPFPSFPEDLDYSQLSFNVIISFEFE